MRKIIIASGPVIIENDQVLLNQHGDTTFWKFCGGKVETLDQSLQEAARREVREEMGIDVEILDPSPFLFHTVKRTSAGSVDVVLIHFLAKRIGEIDVGKDIRAWGWIPLKNLLEMEDELAPNILPTLRHFEFID